MSSAAGNNLSRKKIQQLLAAVGSAPTEDTTQIEATEYDWHRPHCFSGAQLNKLDLFTKKVAAEVACKFADFYQSDFDVTVGSTTLHFAAELFDQASEQQNNYYLAFGTDQRHRCGLVSISAQAAVAWTTRLLGDSESKEEPDRDLSQLEESLLLDIASSVVEAISGSHNGLDFQLAGDIVKDHLPLELQGPEEVCRIIFNIKKADSDDSSEVCLLVLCNELRTVVAKTAQTNSQISDKDIANAMLDHLQEMPVCITAQLASVVLTFEEIISLQVNDILLLDKKIDEPTELLVDGQTLLRGRPAKSAGNYAVVITEILTTN